MKFPISFRGIRKSFLILFVLALVGGYSVHDAVSHYTGGVLIAGHAELGGCGGPQCHAPASSTSTVVHLFTPSQINAGKTYTFTVSVSNKTHPLDIAAGFDVDVDTPAILAAIPGMNTTITSPDSTFFGEWSISHSVPQFFDVNGGDSAVWSFLYTAPKVPGIYPIYVAGNAVNGDSATANDTDNWNDITVNLTVLPANEGVAPDASQQSIQIYPNPASNELFIGDGNLADVGSYTLSDAAGRVVKYGSQITLDGKHSVDLSKIAAGAYIVSVQPRMGQAFSRRIVIQR